MFLIRMCTYTFSLIHFECKFEILYRNSSEKSNFTHFFNFPLSFFPSCLFHTLRPAAPVDCVEPATCVSVLVPGAELRDGRVQPHIRPLLALLRGQKLKNPRAICVSVLVLPYIPYTARTRGKGKNASPKRLPAFVDV